MMPYTKKLWKVECSNKSSINQAKFNISIKEQVQYFVVTRVIYF